MKTLLTIGELLIDFIPLKSNDDSINPHYEAAPGGAPANVAVQASKLGTKTLFLSQVGKDTFGDFLIKTLHTYKVETKFIKQSDEANTALAFVSLDEEANRSFAFYRDPSADQLYDLSTSTLNRLKYDAVHFCSVALIGDYPMKEAHFKLIEHAKSHGKIISFDPNIRLPLIKDHESLKETLWQMINYADIIKVSDEELTYITDCEEEEKALKMLTKNDDKLILYTLGKNGARLIYKKIDFIIPAYTIKPVDTTGSGDAFAGAFLHQLLKYENMKEIDESTFKLMVRFANAAGAITALKNGAMQAMPDLVTINKFQKHDF